MSPLPIADIPSDTVKRITIAADQLYEEGGRSGFPNVDAVRRKARVNMNDASNVMRAWRRAQTEAAAPLTSSIPSAVQTASQAMLTAVWNAATNAANTNLQTAQAGWEQERAEAEACRFQLATAFDSQSEELAVALRNVAALEQKLNVQAAELLSVTANIEKLRHEVAEAQGLAATSAIRSGEIAKRADDLKTELVRAHASADQERSDARSRLDAADTIVTRLREELRHGSDRESAMREELAHVRGKVEAMATEHRTLLGTLSSYGKGRKDSARSGGSETTAQ